MLVWLSVWSEVQIVCIWSSWCHCFSKTPSSLDSFKSRLVLPFWYHLTQVVVEKRPLNGCISSKGKQSIAVCKKPHCYGNSRAMWDHTGRGDIPALTPAEAGTRLSDPVGMQGWVDLVGVRWYTRPKTVTHPSCNRARRALTSFIDELR